MKALEELKRALSNPKAIIHEGMALVITPKTIDEIKDFSYEHQKEVKTWGEQNACKVVMSPTKKDPHLKLTPAPDYYRRDRYILYFDYIV